MLPKHFKTVIWVVGLQQAGKSHLTKLMKEHFGVKVLRLGQEIRNMMDVTTFVKSDNAYAPKEVEEFVQHRIKQEVEEFALQDSVHTTLMIDSAPRNFQQFDLMLRLKERLEINMTVLFVLDDANFRENRIKDESEEYKDYYSKREQLEVDHIFLLKEWCRNNFINVITINQRFY